MLLGSPLFAALFTSDSPGLEVIIFFIPALLLIYEYAVPFVLSLIYSIFGAEFFLFSWVDNALVILIEHYLSNLSLFNLWTIFTLSFIAVQDSEDTWATSEYGTYHTIVAVIQFAISLYFWNRRMLASVNAIRYLDPEWNKVSAGNRLWPSIAYLVRLAKYDNAGSKSSEKETQNDAASADEIKDDVWTLMVEY